MVLQPNGRPNVLHYPLVLRPDSIEVGGRWQLIRKSVRGALRVDEVNNDRLYLQGINPRPLMGVGKSISMSFWRASADPPLIAHEPANPRLYDGHIPVSHM